MSKAGGTISQQAAVHSWLAADAHGNKQTVRKASLSLLYVFFWAISTGTECFETSAYKIHTPGNYPEESTQH
jgi:hypothetical protein